MRTPVSQTVPIKMVYIITWVSWVYIFVVQTISMHSFVTKKNWLINFICRLNGHSTCPDCRTIINDKTGINTIYPHFIEPDNLQSLALVRVENEKRVLVGQLLESKSALMKISMELKKEKIKSTHLTSKVGTLTKKLELADQSCLHCGIEKGTKKAVATKPKTKVSVA